MALFLKIVGALCFAYGISVFFTLSGTLFYAVWLVLGAVLFALGWAVGVGWWAGVPFAVRCATAVLAGVLAVGLAISVAFIMTGFDKRGEPDLDVIVVLGAQVRDSGPSIVLRHRLDVAYDYLVRNENTRCIVSGGQGFNEPAPEAAVMVEYLVGRGIPRERITVEDKSTNTNENIENSLTLIDPENDRVGIVTNNFHVFRATGIARKKGIAHVCGIAAESNPWYLPNNMLRESLSLAKDFLCGNL